MCLLPGADEVDHIVPASRGGSDDETNLAAIHHMCHLKKTAQEARGGPRARPKEAHPGEVTPAVLRSGAGAGGRGWGATPSDSASQGVGIALSTGPELQR